MLVASLRSGSVVTPHRLQAYAHRLLSSLESTETPTASGRADTTVYDNPKNIDHEHDPLIRRVLRESHAAEVAAVAFFEGQRIMRHGRIDLQHFRDQEADQLAAVEQLLPKHRARPSALLGLLSTASMALGAVTAVAPRNVGLAVAGALQDALSDHFTDHLRELRENGAVAEAADVREMLRSSRDLPRAPHGAPPAPDIVALQQMQRLEDIGVQGAVGAVVKAGARAALNWTSKY